MAPIYADHPFALIPSPAYANAKAGAATDMFDKCASEMACVHNMMVRGLNAIYLQAPHVSRADERGFLEFAAAWFELLRTHHTNEEEDFFPTVEAMAGEKGLMEGNVEQHHAFHDPLGAFGEYLEACTAGRERYDGGKVVGLIDAFGPTLMQHLADEIPTLQGLRKYGLEKMADLPRKFDEEGEKSMKSLGLRKLTILLSTLDVHFEEDTHIAFPPMPAPVNFITRRIVWWFASGATKFGACDRWGNLKPLYAVPA